MNLRTVHLGVFAMFLFGAVAFAAPLDTWHWRNPLPQGNNLNSIAYGNGRLVAVGEGGTVMVSTNLGTNWDIRVRVEADTQFPIWMRRIAFGNGVFVAADFTGIFTSTDGFNWTLRANLSVTEIEFCGGQFVVMGYGATAATSSNGVDWTYSTLPPGVSLYFEAGIAAGNGMTVIAGGRTISFTTNGTDWIAAEPGGIYNLTSAAFDGQQFLVAGWDGVVLTSINGIDWVERTVPGGYSPYFLDALSHNGRTILVGQTFATFENSVATLSPDFYTSHYSDPVIVNHVTLAGNVFFGVGEAGGIYRSSDGVNWAEVSQRLPLPVLTGLSGIAYDGKKFVVAGLSWVSLVSTNGSNWSLIPGVTNLYVYGLAYGNGRFVAVGGDAAHPLGEPFASSPDGTNWTLHAAPEGVTTSFNGVKFLNGRFVAYGPHGHVAVSTNGADWTVTVVGLEWLQAVTYGEGKYLVAGQNALFTSTDATNWTRVPIGFAEGFYDLAYGRGLFVAACYTSGSSQGIAWSRDGVNWTPEYSYAQTLVYSHGMFLLAGASRIWTSHFGNDFNVRSFACNQSPQGIAFGNGTFVIVGNGASILQSEPVRPAFALDVTRGHGSAPVLRGSAPLDGVFDVEQSADAITWEPFTTVLSTNGSFTVPAGNGGGQKFYRALLQP